MSESESQQKLGSFEQTPGSTDNQSESEDSLRSEAPTKELTTLYETLRNIQTETYDQQAIDMCPFDHLSPDGSRHRQCKITDEISVLPLRIGDWNLVVSNNHEVVYKTTSPAFDQRYGEGGCMYYVETHLNDRGANRDGKYHTRSSKYVGYTNPDQIRNTTINDYDDLTGIRGHSPIDHEGDFAHLSATFDKSESAAEVLYNLLLTLHHQPQPIIKTIPKHPDNGWSAKCHSSNEASWTTNPPNEINKETLEVILSNGLQSNGNKISITAYDEEDSLSERIFLTIDTLNTIPDGLIDHKSRDTYFENTSTAVAAANEILSTTPSELALTRQTNK